jgi:hypothetical protein
VAARIYNPGAFEPRTKLSIVVIFDDAIDFSDLGQQFMARKTTPKCSRVTRAAICGMYRCDTFVTDTLSTTSLFNPNAPTQAQDR